MAKMRVRKFIIQTTRQALYSENHFDNSFKKRFTENRDREDDKYESLIVANSNILNANNMILLFLFLLCCWCCNCCLLIFYFILFCFFNFIVASLI